MMDDHLFEADDASTPLTADERVCLIPSHITLRRELNEYEQANILDADTWAFNRRRRVTDEDFLRTLHKKMFKNVWKWAGEYSRESGRSIGADAHNIRPEMRRLLDDVQYWMENNTYPLDETALRFHHRLTVIHPFSNGNGRFSRLAADLLAVQLKQPRFSWGRESITEVGTEVRSRYVNALRAADAHNVGPLLAFARS
jgi:Fic-DOC domain mobile mystery protein B